MRDESCANLSAPKRVVPKRLRYILKPDAQALSAVLHSLFRVIEARPRAVSFVQRFG